MGCKHQSSSSRFLWDTKESRGSLRHESTVATQHCADLHPQTLRVASSIDPLWRSKWRETEDVWIFKTWNGQDLRFCWYPKCWLILLWWKQVFQSPMSFSYLEMVKQHRPIHFWEIGWNEPRTFCSIRRFGAPTTTMTAWFTWTTTVVPGTIPETPVVLNTHNQRFCCENHGLPVQKDPMVHSGAD